MEAINVSNISSFDETHNLIASIDSIEPGFEMAQRFANSVQVMALAFEMTKNIPTKKASEFMQNYIAAHQIIGQNLLSRNEVWAMQLLFAPTLDPETTMLDYRSNGKVETVPAITVFSDLHALRSLSRSTDLHRALYEKPSLVIIKGAMYSGKSGEGLGAAEPIARRLKQYSANVFEMMGEDTIHARGINGLSVPAHRTNLKDLVRKLKQKPTLVPLIGRPAKLIHAEEVPFMTETLAQADQLKIATEIALSQNTSCLYVGLDNNYLDEPLVVWKALESIAPSMRYVFNCESYRVFKRGGKTEYDAARSTARYLATGGFNWGFPVVIGRVHENVSYAPTLTRYHPMYILREIAPRLATYFSQNTWAELAESYGRIFDKGES